MYIFTKLPDLMCGDMTINYHRASYKALFIIIDILTVYMTIKQYRASFRSFIHYDPHKQLLF